MSSRPYRGRDSFRRVVLVLLLVLTLAVIPVFGVFAQESRNQQLERVEVLPPEQRFRQQDRAAAPSRGYEQPDIPDSPRWDSRGSSEGTGADTRGPSAMPSLSVMTDKSGLSMRSTALPSQVHAINRQDVSRLDIRNYPDLFRKIPGVRGSYAHQGEVGNQIGIRGYNGRHGQDIGVFIDGVPQNFPSAGVGLNGGSEFSWLAPEMIESIEIIKGPFSALYGDGSQAAVINITTRKNDPSSSVISSGANYGGFRILSVFSTDAPWIVTPFLLNEFESSDGYRENTQFSRFSSFSKVSMPLWGGFLSLRHSFYNSAHGAAGTLKVGDIRKGIVDRRDAVNPDDGTDQRRWSIVLNYTPVNMGGGLYLTAYVDDILRNWYYTFPPIPSRNNRDDRTAYGSHAFYNFDMGNVASVAIGGEIKYVKASTYSFNIRGRTPLSVNSNYDFELSNSAWFVQGQLKPADAVKFVGGVRADYFRVSVDNNVRPLNSGTGFPSIVTPRFGVVVTPSENFNIFANHGRGFRSPSVSEMSPSGPKTQPNFGLQPAKTDSYDIGCNVTLFGNSYFGFVYYYTEMEREVRLINNQPVNIGDSRRKGYEVEGKFYASDNITVFANYAWVDAKLKNPAYPGQEYVPFVPEYVVKAGIEFTYNLAPDIKLTADAYYEFFSGEPGYYMQESQVYFGPDYDAYHLNMSCEGRNWGFFVQSLLQPRLYSSDTIGVVGRGQFSIDPKPVWDVRGGLKYVF